MNIETPKEIMWASEAQSFIKQIEKGLIVNLPENTTERLFYKKAIERFIDHNEEKYRGDKEGREFLNALRDYLVHE